MTTKEIQAGIYRHWKGPLYLVLGLAHDANAEEFHASFFKEDGPEILFEKGRTVVVYIGLQLTAAHEGPRLAVRTWEDWGAHICVSKEHHHYGLKTTDFEVCRTKPRFTYVGSEYVSGMESR
jgi:hypothetical protein